MNGKLTYQEAEVRKQKAANLDAALRYLEGRCDSETLLKVDRILRAGLEPTPVHIPTGTA